MAKKTRISVAEAFKDMKPVSIAQLERMYEKKADRSDLIILNEKKVDTTEFELSLKEINNKIAEANSRIHKIAIAVKELQAAMLPPDTPEKKAVRERSAKKIASLAH